MIQLQDLEATARARLDDASALLDGGRWDGAVYLSGYAVEIALKARLCRALNWSEFPRSPGEFKHFQSFRTHDLEVLLKLSGVASTIKIKHMPAWSLILDWDPEKRYDAFGAYTEQQARDVFTAASELLGALL